MFIPTTSLLVLSCVFPTLGSFLSFHGRAWITLVSKRVSPFFRFLRERIYIHLLNTARFLQSCTIVVSSLTSGLHVLSRLGLRIDWFDGKLLDNCPTFDRWACSEPKFLSVRVSKRTLMDAEVTSFFFVFDFSSFHPKNFRNTLCWKCFLKEDCIRSCLTELQSFSLSKIDVYPIHRVLLSFPCLLQVLCTTR